MNLGTKFSGLSVVEKEKWRNRKRRKIEKTHCWVEEVFTRYSAGLWGSKICMPWSHEYWHKNQRPISGGERKEKKRKREKEKKKRTHCWVKEVFTATFGNGFEAVEFACNKSPWIMAPKLVAYQWWSQEQKLRGVCHKPYVMVLQQKANCWSTPHVPAISNQVQVSLRTYNTVKGLTGQPTRPHECLIAKRKLARRA